MARQRQVLAAGILVSAALHAGCGSDELVALEPGVQQASSVGLLHSSFRNITHLNDAPWRFAREDFVDNEPARADFDDSSWLPVSIPHDFNGGSDGVHDDVFDGPDMYLGAGWYRVRVPYRAPREDTRVFLLFEAVSSKSDVWFNGRHLGQHRGGYTAFEVEVTDWVRNGGSNLLAVRSSNQNDPGIAPWMALPFGDFPHSSDYALYGGIYRDVWLVERGPVSVSAHFHETPEVSTASGTVFFRTSIENATASSANVTLLTELVAADGTTKRSAENTTLIAAGTTQEVTGDISLEPPHLWSPDDPYLYTVRSSVFVDDDKVDEIESTLGFRWYQLENANAFMLNGQDTFLQGVNRHQDMEGLGYALPNARHLKDAELIKGMGFNFVRHAHYPADDAFLTACDELGIMVWTEIPVSTSVSPEPEFRENARSQLTEMIRQAYNHPSVILWGIGNESDRDGDSGNEADAVDTSELLTELYRTAKALDRTRPVTGCNFVNSDNQTLVDIYSPQDWSGWYWGEYTDYEPSKLIGEYGASANLSDHDETFASRSDQQPWTQEYATRYHEYKASKGRSLAAEFPGHLAWVAFDFASPRQDRATNPTPYMNQKGLYLHDHETKKDVAYFYESFYTDGAKNPMVYIVSETWTDRLQKPGTLTLWAYSNAETVELFTGTEANPKASSLGTRIRNAGPRGDTRFQWDEASVTGPVLTAEARIGDELVATHSIRFEGDW